MARSVATLIGDLVGSRRSTERRELHDSLRAALVAANAVAPGVQPPWVTAGDEFQATYRTVGGALDAALWIRLELHPIPVRFGIGWGAVTVLDANGIQDGPGWWAARAAIDAVGADETRAATRAIRTAYRHRDRADRPGRASTPDPHSINAALACRDHLLDSADDRDIAILKGLMQGMTQAEIATAEGVSTSAVSQRVRRAGIGVILRAHTLLREIR